jgi:hypothetical protein
MHVSPLDKDDRGYVDGIQRGKRPEMAESPVGKRLFMSDERAQAQESAKEKTKNAVIAPDLVGRKTAFFVFSGCFCRHLSGSPASPA